MKFFLAVIYFRCVWLFPQLSLLNHCSPFNVMMGAVGLTGNGSYWLSPMSIYAAWPSCNLPWRPADKGQAIRGALVFPRRSGYKMKKRVGAIEEFEFLPLTEGRQLHLTIAITGWLTTGKYGKEEASKRGALQQKCCSVWWGRPVQHSWHSAIPSFSMFISPLAFLLTITTVTNQTSGAY